MIPDVGTTCLFTFLVRFAALDGVYRIKAETTFRDAIAVGIDFTESLYLPVGLQLSDFTADYSGYLGDKVLLLESVKNQDVVFYVPESILKNVPDPTIKEYFPLTMVVSLGVHQNTQAVLPLLDTISDQVQAALGIENPVYILTNPDNKAYLTDFEYDQIKQDRQTRITELVPLSVQLEQANRDIIALSARIAEYERRIVEQASD